MQTKTAPPAMHPQDIVLAGTLLTRLPLPHLPESAFRRSAAAVWAYPLVGAVLGALAALVWGIAAYFGLGPWVQAGLALAALAIMTGALHEDGLADTADGFWGGLDADRRLQIMKDSRIGSYGVLALVFGIGLRWGALAETGPAALIAAACLSRAILPGLMHMGPLSRTGGLAFSVGTPALGASGLALALGTAAAIVCVGFGTAVWAVLVSCAAGLGILALARRKINGLTGDVLGAAQQITELTVLLVCIAAL